MGLTFLNPSRSYDATNGTVRFMAYDGLKSVPFAIEVQALERAGFGVVRGETQSLAAFDAVKASIQDAARRIYTRKRQTTYRLTASDLG